jgi:hypothetical protein
MATLVLGIKAMTMSLPSVTATARLVQYVMAMTILVPGVTAIAKV